VFFFAFLIAFFDAFLLMLFFGAFFVDAFFVAKKKSKRSQNAIKKASVLKTQ
jgi:hypothetical protein